MCEVSKSKDQVSFKFGNESEAFLSAVIRQSLKRANDEFELGLKVWPAAAVMCQYLWVHRFYLKNKSLLEIGSGTGVAGIVAAKCGAKVIMSDDFSLSGVQKLMKENCRINDVKPELRSITWGRLSDLTSLPSVDVIIGSDCFYDCKDYEHIMYSVAYLLWHHPNSEFWTSYQVRRTTDISYLLDKWRLCAREVPVVSFDADHSNIAGSCLPGSAEVCMFIITRTSEVNKLDQMLSPQKSVDIKPLSEAS